MSSQLTLTVLGCGSSSGCPVIGCDCEICTGGNKYNQRTRCSAWINIGDKHIIIDTGTDFRNQALREKIPRIDAILYTHPHADHLNGIDDLRAFCFRQRSAIEVYANQFTIDNMTSRFDYAFLPVHCHWNRPVLNPHILSGRLPENVCGIPVYYCDLPHGRWKSTIYRIGNVAWLTDISTVSDEAYAMLQGLDYLFIDCLMDKSYPSHLSVDDAFAYAQKIGAKQTYLIHMTHLLGFDELKARCPANIEPAYDGLRIYSTCQENTL
ncbi:MAG: MBL fold metallo-hydrolase [Neisseriaceae bacterium]|nr:MBL fold metallo-hydrolase [Neisseriaceae bacterium]